MNSVIYISKSPTPPDPTWGDPSGSFPQPGPNDDFWWCVWDVQITPAVLASKAKNPSDRTVTRASVEGRGEFTAEGYTFPSDEAGGFAERAANQTRIASARAAGKNRL